MAAAGGEWENSPSYYELISSIPEFLEKTYRQNHSEETYHVDSTWEYYNFSINDLALVILLAIIWFILRHYATEAFFKPLSHHYSLTPTNKLKMPESAWKFIYFLCAWSYALYVIVLSGKYKFFQKPSTVWNDWNLKEYIPFDIYILYMAQFGFYIHALYATMFLDTWRKDSAVFMAHHILTVTLFSISYSLRCHNIGSLVMFTHDLSEVLLEFTKLNGYFKIQNGKLVQKHEIIANATFFCFTVVWFVGRLYWYPLRVLYIGMSVVKRHFVLPGALLMNSFLWVLLLMNLYWTCLILKILYLVTTGQMKELADTREYDVEQKQIYVDNYLNENVALNSKVDTNGSYDEVVVSSDDAACASICRKKDD